MESSKFLQSQFLSLSANQNAVAVQEEEDGVSRAIVPAPETHGEILLEGTDNLVDVQIQGQYDCEICKMRFDELREYARHRKFHRNTHTGYRKRPRLTDGVIMKDGKYGCQFCPKVFDIKTSYTRHIRIHIRRNAKHSAAVNMVIEMSAPVEVEPMAAITYYGMDPRSDVKDEAYSRVQNKLKAAFDKEEEDDDEWANLRLLSEVSTRDEDELEDEDDEWANLRLLSEVSARLYDHSET